MKEEVKNGEGWGRGKEKCGDQSCHQSHNCDNIDDSQDFVFCHFSSYVFEQLKNRLGWQNKVNWNLTTYMSAFRLQYFETSFISGNFGKKITPI